MEWDDGSTFLSHKGDPVSPSQFVAYLAARVMDEIWNNGTGVTIQGERINNLRFCR